MITNLPLYTLTFSDPKMRYTQNILYDNDYNPNLYNQTSFYF